METVNYDTLPNVWSALIELHAKVDVLQNSLTQQSITKIENVPLRSEFKSSVPRDILEQLQSILIGDTNDTGR